MAVEREEREGAGLNVEEELERLGAGGWGSAGVMPAEDVTADALSMYFSIRRSLFQFMYRSRRVAVLVCGAGGVSKLGEADEGGD